MSQLATPGVPVPAGEDRRLPDVDALTEDVLAVLAPFSGGVVSTDGIANRIYLLRRPRPYPHLPMLTTAIRRLVSAGLVRRDEPKSTDGLSVRGRMMPYWGLTERGMAWVHRAGGSGAR